MTMSAEINELALALSRAQGEITGALRDKTNPFFKTNYADLGSVMAACRKPLSDHELAVTQTRGWLDGTTILTTTLIHSSGQWVSSVCRVKPVKDDPQGEGSALTYARRQDYAAIVGVAQVDDDAAAGSGSTVEHISEEQCLKIEALISDNDLPKEPFMKWLLAKGIEHIDQIPANQYRPVIRTLNKSIEAHRENT